MSVRVLMSVAVALAGLAAPAIAQEAKDYPVQGVSNLGIELGMPPGWRLSRGFRMGVIYDPQPVKTLPPEKKQDLETVAMMLRRERQAALEPQERGKLTSNWERDGLELMMLGAKVDLTDPEAVLHKASFKIETTSLAGKDPELSIHELAAPYIAADRKSQMGFKIVEERDMILADMVALRFITSHQRKAWPTHKEVSAFKEMLYFVSDGVNLYRITCATLEPKEFDRYKPTFEKMAKSFGFIGLF